MYCCFRTINPYLICNSYNQRFNLPPCSYPYAFFCPYLYSELGQKVEQSMNVRERCNAVCGHKIDDSYCGRTCILTSGHWGKHECSEGHTWL